VTKSKKLLVLFIVVVFMVGLVVGCGGQNSQGDPQEVSGGTSEGQQEQEAGNQSEKVYLVGTEPTFPPFEMVDENNKITGFDIDLIKAIAEDQGFKVEIQDLGFDSLVSAVQTGAIDIIASGLSITPERLEAVDFSEPYIDAGLSIAVQHNNETIKGLDDLKGKVVAVQIGTTGADKANDLKEEGLIKDIKYFNTVDVVMMELINGGVDAVINDLPVTEAYMAKQPNKIKVVGEVLESDSYGFAVRKGNKELLEKINAGLKNLIENGKFAEIQLKYFN
jgi:glutamine transport system substrate-binding protein